MIKSSSFFILCCPNIYTYQYKFRGGYKTQHCLITWLHCLLITAVHLVSYLKKKGGKINDKYSSWSKILIGVPEWSILGPLIFNTLYVVCFTFLRTVILQIIRTTLDHIMRVKVPNLFSITTIDNSYTESEDE